MGLRLKFAADRLTFPSEHHSTRNAISPKALHDEIRGDEVRVDVSDTSQTTTSVRLDL
jgi:hypothetical protein